MATLGLGEVVSGGWGDDEDERGPTGVVVFMEG